MKSCRWVQTWLPEYAAGRPLRCSEEIAAHLARCADCAAAEGELRAVFAALAAAEPPLSVEGAGRARRALEAAAASPSAPRRGYGVGRLHLPAGRLGLGAALLLALIVLVPWRGGKTGAAAVEAAVQRANTWHLTGWKLRGGKRVPWEIWGRRSPFFYREQLGDELNFDDGTQRIRVIANRETGKPFALRLEPGPAPSDEWRGWLTMGTGWRHSRAWHETRDGILVYAGDDWGMQGPYSVAETYFTLDKRTLLPARYEYREHLSNSKTPAWVLETLRAQYDVPVPDSVTRLSLPPGVVVADTLSAPTDPSVPTKNVQRAHGLTVQVLALAMDADGNILVRTRSWLGNLQLGVIGSPTFNDVGTDVKYRTYGETRDTAFHTDDGRAYVEFQWPRTGGWGSDNLKVLAPLEPRTKGMGLPRSLTLDLQVTPQVAMSGSSSVLFHQRFLWTVPLPARAETIRMDDYLPRDPRQRVYFKPGVDVSSVESNIDFARAGQYELENEFGRSIYWKKQGLAAVKPISNTAQFNRLGLAHIYEEAGDRRQATAWDRKVIEVSRQHPETWSLYAWDARLALKYMATHKPRRP